MISPRLIKGVLILVLVAAIAGIPTSQPQASRGRSHTTHEKVLVAPVWQQVNSNGFGVLQAGEVSALEVFNGQLYAGTSNATDGARIFRSPDGVSWTPVIPPGFGIAHDIIPPTILDMVVFNSKLYASTGRGDGPSQIWRSVNGVNWSPMTINGFGNPDMVDFTALAVYNGWIYVGANNNISGAQIWRSFSGDSSSWQQVAPAAPGNGPARVTGFAEFGGALYAAVESDAPAQIWRGNGLTWTTVISDGFGSSLTTLTGGMAEFGGFLYVGAGNTTVGAQLYRSNNGVSWEPAIQPGFGDPNNQKVEAVFVFQNVLYASAKNSHTGLELWRSLDGLNWEQANSDGFGDSHNSGSNGSNASANFLVQLYLGTSNVLDGGELWRLQQLSYLHLPVILH